MAFLDNSGDILLDAVLTETGRRRMSTGNFNINSFALGDDEIDYTLYNKNHPSGSAYYDLEILQTPVFEAFTQINAGINYGLLATTATDLLYLPTMHVNSLSEVGGNNIASYNHMYYVTDTSGDISVTKSIKALLGGATIPYMGGTAAASNYVFIETGLDTGFGAVPQGNYTTRQTYLVSNSLVESTVYVYYDTRIINGIVGLDSTSKFEVQGAVQNVSLSLSSAATFTGGGPAHALGLDNYSAAAVNAISDEVYWSSEPNHEQSYSVIGGPRGNAIAVSPVIQPGLDAEYTKYGTTGHVIGTETTRYIDTTIYVQGYLTPGQIQIPVRIIRFG
jgi:hypothetical protein